MAETKQNYGQPVQAPASGQTVAIKAVAGQDILLTAAFDEAEIRMEGGNVVFAFSNGGQVVLDFTDLDYAEAPSVIMPDGSILDMQEYLAALSEGEIEPAAGPEAGGADSGGVGEYQDDAGNLLEGVDKLGVLDPREFTSVSVEALDADPLAEEPDEPVLPENDVPLALADLDFVDPVGTATGNVMTGDSTAGGVGGDGTDIPGNDTPVTVTKIVGAGGENSVFNESGNLFVNGQYGTLTIKADGSYEYKVFGEGLGTRKVSDNIDLEMTAFKFKESFFDEFGNFTKEGATGVKTGGGQNGAYFGVKGTEGQNTAASDQINYSDSYSEALAFHFNSEVVSAQVGVSNMFNTEPTNSGESMRWHAFDADGVRIGTGVVSQSVEGTPYAGTTTIDWNGSTNVGTFTVSGIGVFSTLVFEAVPYGNDGFNASDNSDYFVNILSYEYVPEGGLQDEFTYTITDSNGDSSEAKLTISDLYGKGELVNEHPVAVGNNYGWDDFDHVISFSNEEVSDPEIRPMGVIRGNVITDDEDGGGAGSGRDWDQDTPVLNLKIKSVDGVDLDFSEGPVQIDLTNGTLRIKDDGSFEYELNDEYFFDRPVEQSGDSFTYTIMDVHGYESDAATVTIDLLIAQQTEGQNG